jgi:hypothetical protein
MLQMGHKWLFCCVVVRQLCIPCAEGAVIEVTTGGDVLEATYMFSDELGQTANFSGSREKIQASTDVMTGNGNSVDGMAVRLAAAESAIIEYRARLEALEHGRFIGVGSCWDAARTHAGGTTSHSETDTSPANCYARCIATYASNCAGFDTRTGCLSYTLAGQTSNAITQSKNCGVNGNQAGCDTWSGGSCYAVP